MSKTSPVTIRRAGPNDGVPSRDELSATPGGQNLFGTTPGGSRIVYSREQLLSLASSPLSQTPPRHLPLSAIPAEISRSPEKSQVSVNGGGVGGGGGGGGGGLGRGGGAGLASYTNGGQSGVGANGPGFGGAGSLGRSPEKASLRGLAAGNRAFGATPGAATATFEHAGASRSPGTAFNFSKGPVSPSSAGQQPGSFREKLAMQSSPTKASVEGVDGDRRVQPQTAESGPGPASGSLAGGAHTGDEQFDMEM
ncbi:hypothetical protein FA10DRAFT_269541 [Acaromyces ingoldii]|uniref:Eukaryotic translation initiation factor 4E binding protein n=1 Tax=Acaromyces ingoldii TaxID=215250 RepID=A0A316YG39_9BASI|nr:hypothetical protein FA10DRAFT_269541 [Acaromyces ingoldii]PWN87588.1 hypothetical protein FA10DRAFT_269541 [Acaromyces ingoldii]